MYVLTCKNVTLHIILEHNDEYHVKNMPPSYYLVVYIFISGNPCLNRLGLFRYGAFVYGILLNLCHGMSLQLLDMLDDRLRTIHLLIWNVKSIGLKKKL